MERQQEQQPQRRPEVRFMGANVNFLKAVRKARKAQRRPLAIRR